MKRILNDSLPWATFVVVGFAVLYALAGFVQVVLGDLEFEKYGTLLLGFSATASVLGVGRGIAARKQPAMTATATVEASGKKTVTAKTKTPPPSKATRV